jgi:hypothetical protein
MARVWSIESGGRFCFGAFGRNIASVVMNMFAHLISFVHKCYKCCIFSVVCKR